jgi:hypothetical protein
MNHTYLIIVRCANHDIPVGFYGCVKKAMGAAVQLAHDLKENYALLRTYAQKVQCDAHDPICVSVYEFCDQEIRGVVGSYHVCQPLPRLAVCSE